MNCFTKLFLKNAIEKKLKMKEKKMITNLSQKK